MNATDPLLDWLSACAADIIVDADDQVLVADRLAAALRTDAAAFAATIIDVARISGESVRTPRHFQRLSLLPEFESETDLKAATLLSAAGMAIGIGRVAWASRPQARQARALLIDRAHAAYAVASPLGPDLYAWLAGLVSVAVRLVSDLAANATPVVVVESGISLPSTVLAYQMYGTAERAAGLVDISGSATAMIMPVRFEALAS